MKVGFVQSLEIFQLKIYVCTLFEYLFVARPTQCRTYPFWPQHLISTYDWKLAAKECEGIQMTAEEYTPPSKVLREAVIHEVSF